MNSHSQLDNWGSNLHWETSLENFAHFEKEMENFYDFFTKYELSSIYSPNVTHQNILRVL